jgi:biopolymer transport protein ExbD
MARSKPTERQHGGHDDGEALDLDVTPFLNIMFMLILSILAMTSWTQLALIGVQAPQIAGGAAGGAAGDPSAAASQLNLTVFVLKDGFNLAATGATLDGNTEGRPGQVLIPKITGKDGRPMYDFDKLHARLIDIKKTFPQEENMILSADADVAYDDIIHTMDAARTTGKDNAALFPAVAFAAGIVG